MDEPGEQRRCEALLPGRIPCSSWPSDPLNTFCPSHKEELGKLVRAYKDADKRANVFKPRAVTTKEQLYALYYSVDELTAAEAPTAGYLEALRAELRGRTTVRDRFYSNSVEDGHLVRITNLVNEEATITTLLDSLRARAISYARVPRQPLRPVATNRAAPVAWDREYSDGHFMPVDHGHGRPYEQPAWNGGMPDRRPQSPPDRAPLVRILVYAVIAYGAYNVSKFMLRLVAESIRREIQAVLLGPVMEPVRLATSWKPFAGTGEWVQTLGTNISEKVGDFAREKLNLPIEPSEFLKFKDDALENARKGIMERSAWAWTSLSQLATQGLEAASNTVASSVNDPNQAAKNAADGLSEAREWVMERSGPLWMSFSKLVEDCGKAAATVVGDEVKK